MIVKFPALVRALYWDSDAAGALVLGQLAPLHGGVHIPRFGWWSSLWWLLATRHVPGHVQVWEATGYVFALATAALVGWATVRVAGRWAGVTAAAATVAVGPKTLSTLLTVNFHTSTPFTVAVLSVYLTFLARSRSWALAGAVGVVAGVNAASDPLLWIAGLAPFALAAGLLAYASRRRAPALRAGATLAIAALVSFATDFVMHHAGFHVIPAGLQHASLAELPRFLVTLGKSIALIFGANFLSEPTYPADPLRYVVALLGLLGVAAAFVAAARFGRRPSDPVLRAFPCFWAAAVAGPALAYWSTDLAEAAGPGGGSNYMLAFAPAAGVGIGLLAAGSSRRRLAVSLALGLVAVTNMAGIADGRAEDLTAQPYRLELLHMLESEGLVHGYAPYWDAQSLTWKSGNELVVAPVRPCDVGSRRAVCREYFFTIDAWYRERPGRSFLIVDPAAGFAVKPPRSFGRPSAVLRPTSEPDAAVYVYPYDLARHIRD